MSTELLQQIDALLDGELDASAARELSQRLREDVEARRLYIQQLDLHAAMQWRTRDRAGENSKLEIRNSNFHLRRTTAAGSSSGSSFGFRVSSLSIAAALALLITGWFIFKPEPRTLNPRNPEPSAATQSVAMLSNFSAGAVFSESPAPMTLGADLGPGRITLASGRAQLVFKSGAAVELQGPCEFEMTGINSGRLALGRLTAHVPQAAAGFTVIAPHDVRVTDLGTRFEMVVSEGGRHLDTWVREGTVQIQSGRLGSRVLTAGQSVSLVDGELVQPLLVNVTASSGRAYPIVRGGFIAGAVAYTDRDYTWTGLDDPQLPAGLRGADYVQTLNEDKADTKLAVTLKLSGPATVWVLWNPNAPEPGWLIDGFENLPHHVTLAIEASEQSPKARTLDYTLWRRRVEAAGGLVLGARQIADRRSPAGMYGIVVTGPDRSMESHVEKSEAQRSK